MSAYDAHTMNNQEYRNECLLLRIYMNRHMTTQFSIWKICDYPRLTTNNKRPNKNVFRIIVCDIRVRLV